MEEVTIISSKRSTPAEPGESSVTGIGGSRSISGLTSSVANLISQCGINFFLYLKSLNLSGRSDILVLPSNNHYYYDGKELKGIRVLINLKRLNLIKHVDLFLSMLIRVLPADAEFVGCFSDSGNQKREKSYFGRYTKLFNRLMNLLDPGSDRIMDRSEVTSLLERSGFRPLDMREMRGLTYFCCKCTGTPHN